MRVRVHVVPRAKRTAVVGVHGNRLKLALAAPPVDGAANAELVAFVARALGVTRRAVAIVAGETSRQKTLEITGVSADEVRARLGPPRAARRRGTP